MRTVIRMGVAALAFAALHTTLAARGTKHRVVRAVGERRFNATYRSFFIVQSLLTFALLAAYGNRLPKRTLYRIHGPFAWVLHAGQLWGVWQAWLAARQIGLARLTGVQNLLAWRRGETPPPGPFAQGPESGPDGQLSIGGPFLRSRHPLNFAGIPIFWCTPHMTTRRLAFNLVSSIYFILGSWHEAARLREAYGAAYRAYERSGIPFYWPQLPALVHSRPLEYHRPGQ